MVHTPRPRSRLIRWLVQTSTRWPFHTLLCASLVRIVLVVFAVFLSGCFAQEPTDEPEDDLWQPCPQWIAGDGPVASNATIAFDHHMDGYPLDLLTLELTADGAVKIWATNDAGRRLGLVTDTTNPSLSLHNETVDISIFLAPADHGKADPGNVTIMTEGEGTISLVATPWYKVCGI